MGIVKVLFLAATSIDCMIIFFLFRLVVCLIVYSQFYNWHILTTVFNKLLIQYALQCCLYILPI